MSGGKSIGCLARESENDPPISTSLATWLRMVLSFLLSVCSARMCRAFSSGRPALIIVASWRLEIASDLRSTPFSKPDRLISMLRPLPTLPSSTESGDRPMLCSLPSTADSLGASSLPLTTLPDLLRLV